MDKNVCLLHGLHAPSGAHLGWYMFFVPLLGIQDGLVEFVGFTQKQMDVHYILQVARAKT